MTKPIFNFLPCWVHDQGNFPDVCIIIIIIIIVAFILMSFFWPLSLPLCLAWWENVFSTLIEMPLYTHILGLNEAICLSVVCIHCPTNYNTKTTTTEENIFYNRATMCPSLRGKHENLMDVQCKQRWLIFGNHKASNASVSDVITRWLLTQKAVSFNQSHCTSQAQPQRSTHELIWKRRKILRFSLSKRHILINIQRNHLIPVKFRYPRQSINL